MTTEEQIDHIKYISKCDSYKAIGFTASCFDILHAGHCLMLKEAKDNCDILVVALQTDPTIDRPYKNKPVQTFKERRTQVESNKYVDYILEYTTEDELLKILKRLMPDIRFLGDDYVGKQFTGNELPIFIHYCDRSHGYSTTSLRNRVVEAYRESLRTNFYQECAQRLIQKNN